MREFDARVINTTVPAVGRTTYTTADPVGGVPVGAIIHVAGVASLDTPVSGLSLCVGYADNANENEVSIGVRSKDNSATSVAKSHGAGSVIRLMRDTGVVLAEATVKTWVTDGIELDFTTATVGLKMSITLIFGTDTECFAFRGARPTSGNPTTVNVGFATDVVITSGDTQTLGVDQADAILMSGLADSAGTNVLSGFGDDDLLATTSTKRAAYNNRLTYGIGFPTTSANAGTTTIGTYTATTFDLIYGGTNTDNPGLIGLAIRLPAGHAWSITGPVQYPNTTGTKTFSVGHKTAFIYTVNSTQVNLGDNTAGAMGLGVSDAFFDQSGFAISSQNGQATSNTATVASTGSFHYLMGHDQALKQKSAVVSIAATTFSHTIANAANGRRWSVLSIAESPYTIVGAGSVGALTGAGVAAEGFAFDGAGSLAGLSMAASVTVTTATTTTIVGAGSIPSVSGAAVAAETFTAVGAGGLAGLLAAAVAAEGFAATAAGSFASLTGAGVVGEAFAATGAGSVPQVTAAGVLAEGFTSIAAGALSGPTMAAVVTHTIPTTITAAGAVPNLVGAGVLSEGFTASSAGAVQSVAGAGVATEVFAAAAAGALAPLTGVGAASVGYAAAVTGPIPALSSRGFVDEGFTATGSGSLVGLSMAASVNSGATTVVVAGAVPTLVSAGVVAEGFASTASGSVQSPSMAAVVGLSVSVAGAGQISGLSAAAVVSESYAATGAGSIGALTAAAALAETFVSNTVGSIQGPTMAAVVTQVVPTTIVAQGAVPSLSMAAVVTLIVDVSSLQLTFGVPEAAICAATVGSVSLTYTPGTLNQLTSGVDLAALTYTPPADIPLTFSP